MTDPELADATYIEPITPEMVAKIIARERPQALLPTMGGQTALNIAMALARSGILERYGVELIGATEEAIAKAEDRQLFRQAMDKIGLASPKSRLVRSVDEAVEALEGVGLPAIIRPSFTLGGTGGGIAYNARGIRGHRSRRAAGLADPRGADRGIGPRLEGIRDGGGPRPRGQLHHRLLDREYRSDGDSHRRLGLRRAGADPDRQGIPADAQRRDRGVARDRRRHRRVERAVRGQPGDGRLVVIEMNPRVSRSSALASKATGFPIAKIAAKLAVGYTLDELDNEITRITPASFEPTIDYVVTKMPRFTFEKFPGAEPLLTTSMKSVGEAMAIGRSFAESVQKALRSLETGLSGFDEVAIEGVESAGKDAVKAALAKPSPDRLLLIAQAYRHGLTTAEIHAACRFERWFLDRIREIVEIEERVRRDGLPHDRTGFLRLKQMGFSDARLGKLAGLDEEAVAARRRDHDLRPVYKRDRHLRGRVPLAHPVHVFLL